MAFFVLWLLLVFVSFFAFFIPDLRGIFYLDLDILLASLVLMVTGGLVVVASVRGWWSNGADQRWFGDRVTAQTYRDRLTPGQRFGEVFGVFVSFLILLFFIENQARNTGFFTSRFGLVEQALFYGSWAMGATVSLSRAIYGKRNAIRPLDALSGFLLLVTAVWLFEVFPFDFGHFTDLMPAAIRFAFTWVSNPIAEIGLVLMAVGGLVSTVYNSVVFAFVRSRQHYRGTPVNL